MDDFNARSLLALDELLKFIVVLPDELEIVVE
jgi:hypothetical protein